MNYRAEVMKNCPGFYTETFDQKLSLGALGAAGESGEVADLVKKILHHSVPLADVRDKLIKEIGDVYWYLEYLCATLELSDAATITDGFPTPSTNASVYKRLSYAALRAASCGGFIAEYATLILHLNGELPDYQDEIVGQIADLYFILRYLCGVIGTTEEEVKQANVDKLAKRHPNGWSPESQNAKADEKMSGQAI